jgi:7-carboxy-7-deazaguanine synthase
MTTLPVMESFYTIQGEGFYTGRAAYFIRLGGCDIGCNWCDVKESWDIHKHPQINIENLISKAKLSNSKFVVITGGEPAMHDIKELVSQLHISNIEVAIETSGAYEVTGDVDWYCFSPKKFKPAIDEAYERANELKVVINHPSDFAWAEIHASRVKQECKFFLQPEWEKKERFLPLIVDYVKFHSKWRISLQTHKYLNIP